LFDAFLAFFRFFSSNIHITCAVHCSGLLSVRPLSHITKHWACCLLRHNNLRLTCQYWTVLITEASSCPASRLINKLFPVTAAN